MNWSNYLKKTACASLASNWATYKSHTFYTQKGRYLQEIYDILKGSKLFRRAHQKMVTALSWQLGRISRSEKLHRIRDFRIGSDSPVVLKAFLRPKLSSQIV